MEDDASEPVEIPITGELDLHAFAPRDVAELLDAYFEACRDRGIFTIRVIHGKGIGTLRQTVHARLRQHPLVRGFAAADERSGGWGATWVTLRRPGEQT